MEHYADPTFRYAGLIDLAKHLIHKNGKNSP